MNQVKASITEQTEQMDRQV